MNCSSSELFILFTITFLVTCVATQDCRLPRQFSNGNILGRKSRTRLRLGSSIQEYASVIIECDQGYNMYPPYGRITCYEGNWDRLSFPKCLKHCGELVSSTVEFSCSYHGQDIDCSQPIPHGSKVFMTCKKLYELADGSDESSQLRCARGIWKGNEIQCLPSCGKSYSKGTAQTFVIGGHAATKGDYPWHVAVFMRNETTNDIINICGGSIIHPKLVISAAHCFSSKRGEKYSKELYYIGAGKHYRQYNDPNDQNSQQIRKVDDIMFPGIYQGLLSEFEGDLAIVVLNQPLIVTPAIQPICIQWNDPSGEEMFTLPLRGKVIGWGFSKEGGDPSNELQELTVPFRADDECARIVTRDFMYLLKRDKLCAGYTNGSSVCHGDSGGGLVIYNDKTKRFYLHGVVSSGPTIPRKVRNLLRNENGYEQFIEEIVEVCDSKKFQIYTRVAKYIDLIGEVEAYYRS